MLEMVTQLGACSSVCSNSLHTRIGDDQLYNISDVHHNFVGTVGGRTNRLSVESKRDYIPTINTTKTKKRKNLTYFQYRE